jgi:hypothetical protein
MLETQQWCATLSVQTELPVVVLHGLEVALL